MRRIWAALAGTAALIAAPAGAATLTTNGSNQLTGVTGLTVGSSTFDVTFTEGTCAGVFSGCDSLSDFTFQNQTDARTAGTALLAAIAGTSFDSAPGTTFGCIGADTCFMFIPYALGGSSFTASGPFNGPVSNSNSTDVTNSATTFDTTGVANQVWAVFSLSTAVPEPSTWAMMLLGFAGIGLAVRRKNKAPVAA